MSTYDGIHTLVDSFIAVNEQAKKQAIMDAAGGRNMLTDWENASLSGTQVQPERYVDTLINRFKTCDKYGRVPARIGFMEVMNLIDEIDRLNAEIEKVTP